MEANDPVKPELTKTIKLHIKRQDSPEAKSRYEDFEIEWHPNMNVVSALMAIRAHPVLADGTPTTPVVWESVCLEEVCGACTMLINGVARQACSTLIDPLEQPITLAPLTKFPLVRDLKVDRQKLFEHLKRVHAWIDIDGVFDLGPGPRMSQETLDWAYELSKCMTCGCCFEACPNTKLAEAYEQANPEATIEVQQSDSTTGVTMAIEGTCDIGMASRELKDSETGKGAQSQAIARDGIAVIVPVESAIEGLTSDQVKQIFSGKITSWSDVK